MRQAGFLSNKSLRLIHSSLLVAALLLTSSALSHAQTITVWILDSNDQVHQVWRDEWIPEFEARHPGVTVEFEKASWVNLVDKLVVALAAGVGPDIVQGGAEFRAMFAESGIARPVDDFLETWPEWQDFAPGTWETVVWNGQAYGVPALTAPRTFVYNKAIFSEVGLPPDPPATWDDLRTIALRTNRADGDGNLTRVGLEARKFAGGLHFVLPFLLQNEVDMLTPDGTKAAFNTPAGVETLEYLIDLSQNVSPLARTQLLGNDVSVNFVEGKSAMMYSNAGIINIARQRDPGMVADIGVAPPLTHKVQAGVTYTDWWAVTQASPNPELAFEFIKFLSEPDRLTEYNHMIGTIPPRNESITTDWMTANPDMALFAEVVLPHAKSYYSSQHAPQLLTIFEEVLGPTLDGVLAPTEALQTAADRYDALFW